MADNAETGIVNLNHEVHSIPELPLDDVKKSGIGLYISKTKNLTEM
jgi:acyl-CoA reductase-like NAD-dependent aldehyde dehydrogenase